jgi:hypothetical protein
MHHPSQTNERTPKPEAATRESLLFQGINVPPAYTHPAAAAFALRLRKVLPAPPGTVFALLFVARKRPKSLD